MDILKMKNGNFALFVDGEFYAEGTYEQMEQMQENITSCRLDEENARCNAGYEEY